MRGKTKGSRRQIKREKLTSLNDVLSPEVAHGLVASDVVVKRRLAVLDDNIDKSVDVDV